MSQVLYTLKLFFETTPSNAEISCNGFLPNDKMESHYGDIGILLNGYVTFAGNHMDSVWSGESEHLRWSNWAPEKRTGHPRRPGRLQSLESIDTYKIYILDSETFDRKYSGVNELIVDNWKPISIVIKSEHWSTLGPKWRTAFFQLANDNHVSLVDQFNKPLPRKPLNNASNRHNIDPHI